MGDILRTSQNGNVYWQHDEAIWDAPNLSTSCASRNFTVPSAAVWRVRKDLAAKAFPSALFHSLLLDFVIVQAYAGIPLQANLLTEN